MERLQNRLVYVEEAVGALPLEVADPDHHLRQLGRELVLLDAVELGRRYSKLRLRQSDTARICPDLFLKVLELVERDVEEITAPTGRVQYSNFGELLHKVEQHPLGDSHQSAACIAGQRLPLLAQRLHPGLDVLPLTTERSDKYRLHNQQDVVPASVVRAELRPL